MQPYGEPQYIVVREQKNLLSIILAVVAAFALAIPLTAFFVSSVVSAQSEAQLAYVDQRLAQMDYEAPVYQSDTPNNNSVSLAGATRSEAGCEAPTSTAAYGRGGGHHQPYTSSVSHYQDREDHQVRVRDHHHDKQQKVHVKKHVTKHHVEKHYVKNHTVNHKTTKNYTKVDHTEHNTVNSHNKVKGDYTVDSGNTDIDVDIEDSFNKDSYNTQKTSYQDSFNDNSDNSDNSTTTTTNKTIVNDIDDSYNYKDESVDVDVKDSFNDNSEKTVNVDKSEEYDIEIDDSFNDNSKKIVKKPARPLVR